MHSARTPRAGPSSITYDSIPPTCDVLMNLVVSTPRKIPGVVVPIYEYACGKCHAKFDHLHRSMANLEKVKCPKCGSSQTTRALSVFAVGSESAGKSSQPMCGRCGGPGPCAMD